MPFYAVRNGYEPGIYLSWENCEKQVKGFSKAVYKKFETKVDAVAFILNKSPNKSQENLSKDSPKIKNPDFSKESTDHSDLNQKRKFNNDESNLSNATTSIKSKEKEMNNLRPEKKARTTQNKMEYVNTCKEITKKILDTPIDLKKYLTEYEDKIYEFSFKSQKAIVYTDGACSNNGKPNAAAGIGVFWGKNHPLNISKRLNGLQTNNRAEINAAIVAISQALTYDASELTIYTDSKFMMNSINDWINKWKKNGWKTSSGESVKNIDDFKRLDDLCSKIKINWIYVPGHKGHYGNEEADRLATQCLK
ncbi:ribonuclease H1 [Brachionus plicatilis]|uniref:Ribonuclease H1 n=1 Tax=Brachionus plicatilis TaxID=10195 RepID=A0A3M7PMS8_BRAPC|nr:ribonuclease H1 [Brachionus plicatilis]